MFIKSKTDLQNILTKYSHVILYGANDVGKTLMRYFQKQNLSLNISIASHPKKQSKSHFFGYEISPITKFKKNASDSLLLVAIKPENYATNESYFEGFQNVYFIDYSFYCTLAKEENEALDFLAVGFVKSGTSSLHAILRKHPQVFLPRGKETKYILWRRNYEDSPSRCHTLYYMDALPNQKKGAIEPSYLKSARSIYECYGSDIKLIFMMRNPVDAAYSYFKMMMRNPVNKHLVSYYLKHFSFSPDMFRTYITEYVTNPSDLRFHYDIWIYDYLKYFKKENMHFIIFEEIIKSPQKYINEVEEFLEIKKKRHRSLPHRNSGSKVSKNLICAYINYKILQQKIHLKSHFSVSKWEKHKKLTEKIQRYTLMEYNEKILPEQREELTSHFLESFHQIENLTGKNLKGIWY